MSWRRRSSRTALAWLHRTCGVERRNTNVEELTKNNTADLFTEHRERSRSQGNFDLESWMVRMVTTESFRTALPVEQVVSILSSNSRQDVHDNTSLRQRPRPHGFALMPPWASRHIGGSRSIPSVHRCPQGKAVGCPNAPQATTSRKQDSDTCRKSEREEPVQHCDACLGPTCWRPEDLAPRSELLHPTANSHRQQTEETFAEPAKTLCRAHLATCSALEQSEILAGELQ